MRVLLCTALSLGYIVAWQRWRVNKEDVKLRKTLGAGRTMKLLEAEMEELEDEGDNLVQQRRMAEKEKNDFVLERADAAEAHAALLENGALTMPCTAQERALARLPFFDAV